jgi:hypothetical protein
MNMSAAITVTYFLPFMGTSLLEQNYMVG